MSDFLGKRAGFWHYMRRVPAVFAARDRRGIVKQSTKIRVADDPRGIAARRAAARINADTEAYWKSLYLGRADDARVRYAAAREYTRAVGFDPIAVEELAKRPVDEILTRVDVLAGKAPDSEPVAAVLGLVDKPTLRLSGLFEDYERIQAASLADLSPEQKRRWRNAKRHAVDTLIAVIGDKALGEITRHDALEFRAHWQDRILGEGVEIGTANKAIGHLNKMWRVLNGHYRMALEPVFAELRIEGEQTASRTAFAAEFVQQRLLDGQALAGLNDDARLLFYLVADTGLRLSEAANLTAETIRLDHEVPHILVEPEGRRMKTSQSRRAIPLVGCALAAMKQRPEGFVRYRDRNAQLSATLNKYLTENKLRPLPGQSAYSLRHTFEDRLTAVEAPEKLVAALMGHKYIRPKYGAGPSLQQKREWLLKIAFKPPAVL